MRAMDGTDRFTLTVNNREIEVYAGLTILQALTTEGIDDPVKHLAAARIALDVEPDRFRAPAPGESIRLEAASGLATVAGA